MRKKWLLQLDEPREIHSGAYESFKLYKERAKSGITSILIGGSFGKTNLVLLFNSKLKLFSSKLCYRWLNPFKVLNVYPYGVKIRPEVTAAFKVN